MHDKHQIIEEPCEVKVSRTVLETSESREGLAEFNLKLNNHQRTQLAKHCGVARHAWTCAIRLTEILAV